MKLIMQLIRQLSNKDNSSIDDTSKKDFQTIDN